MSERKIRWRMFILSDFECLTRESFRRVLHVTDPSAALAADPTVGINRI